MIRSCFTGSRCVFTLSVWKASTPPWLYTSAKGLRYISIIILVPISLPLIDSEINPVIHLEASVVPWDKRESKNSGLHKIPLPLKERARGTVSLLLCTFCFFVWYLGLLHPLCYQFKDEANTEDGRGESGEELRPFYFWNFEYVN